MIWPFKRNTPAAEPPKEPEYVTLYAEDSPQERAEKIFRILGLVDRFGWTADVAAILADYQRMDREPTQPTPLIAVGLGQCG